MKLTIHVEPYHINHAGRRNTARCPLAYAIGPRTGGHVEVTEKGQVEIYNLIWKPIRLSAPRGKIMVPKQYPGDQLLLAVPLPEDALVRMWDYDDGGIMEPFTFELELPDDWRERTRDRNDDRPKGGHFPNPGL